MDLNKQGIFQVKILKDAWSWTSGTSVHVQHVKGKVKRIEHWVIVKGGGKVIVDNSEHIALPRSSWYIKEKSIHRATAASDGLVFIETQIGECDENDIVRLEDDYGRVGKVDNLIN